MTFALPIESTTSERVNVEVTTTADPTGALPDFAVTTTDTEPSSWVAGSWDGTWDSTTGKVDAKSPTVGAGASLVVAGGTDYDLWIRWTVGSETPVKLACRLRVS